jgi:hypothetical protein
MSRKAKRAGRATPGDFAGLVAAAQARGWEVVRASHHLVLRWPPTGQQVTMSHTASDVRAWHNARSRLRRIEAPPA